MASGLFHPSAFLIEGLYQPHPLVPSSCRTAAIQPTYVRRPCYQPAPLPKPSLRLSEDEAGITITAVLPGYRAGEISVEVEDGILTLSATPAATCDCWQCAPHALPPLAKSFSLPAYIDQQRVAAEFKGGVLTVRLPHRVVQRRRIIIAAAPAPQVPVVAAPMPALFRQQAAVACPRPVAPASKPSQGDLFPADCRQCATAIQPALKVLFPSVSALSAPQRPAPAPRRPSPTTAATKPPAAQQRRVPVQGAGQPELPKQQQAQVPPKQPHGAARASSLPAEEPLIQPAAAAERASQPVQQQHAEAQPAGVDVTAKEATEPSKQPEGAAAAEDQATAAQDKGKAPMSEEQQADFLRAQAEAKKLQARLRGEHVDTDSDSEDGSIEDCEF
ncbi:hypothetical protein N2152v2_009211 [Parachlorella kessleri]